MRGYCPSQGPGPQAGELELLEISVFKGIYFHLCKQFCSLQIIEISIGVQIVLNPYNYDSIYLKQDLTYHLLPNHILRANFFLRQLSLIQQKSKLSKWDWSNISDIQGNNFDYITGGLRGLPSPPEPQNQIRTPLGGENRFFSNDHKFLLAADIHLKLSGFIHKGKRVFCYLVKFSIRAHGGARGPRVTFTFRANFLIVTIVCF